MFNEGGEGKARMEGGGHDKETASSKFNTSRGVARIFQRGGHTVSKQELFNYGQDMVMVFPIRVKRID